MSCVNLLRHFAHTVRYTVMKNSGQHQSSASVCGYVSLDACMLSNIFSQFNRLYKTEESFHVSHCFFSIFDTTLVMNLKLFLALASYKSRKVFLSLGLKNFLVNVRITIPSRLD